MTRQEQINEAKNILRTEDSVFIECVNELDSWNGFAEGYRCNQMWELNDLYGDMNLREFLDHITDDFNTADDYIYESIYGLESTSDIEGLYRSNASVDEVFDNLLDNWSHLEICGADDFCDLMDDIYNYEGTDDEDEQEEELPYSPYNSNRNDTNYTGWIDEQ